MIYINHKTYIGTYIKYKKISQLQTKINQNFSEVAELKAYVKKKIFSFYSLKFIYSIRLIIASLHHMPGSSRVCKPCAEVSYYN